MVYTIYIVVLLDSRSYLVEVSFTPYCTKCIAIIYSLIIIACEKLTSLPPPSSTQPREGGRKRVEVGRY